MWPGLPGEEESGRAASEILADVERRLVRMEGPEGVWAAGALGNQHTQMGLDGRAWREKLGVWNKFGAPDTQR